MSLMLPPAPPRFDAIVYPDDDGLPMADNTRQLQWIVMLYGNLCALFHAMADVFVAGNHLWYPVEGHPEIRCAPDAMVVFGRPKGHRGSYKQWEEGDVPVTVAFEILSPGNTATENANKFAFYDDYGVEEYYQYDPEENRLHVFLRRGEVLVRIRKVHGFVSPRLGIRFDLSGPEMVVFHPDGRRFLTFEELDAERVQMAQQARDADKRAKDAEDETKQARQDAEAAQREATQARLQIEAAQREADQAGRRLTRLRELSRKARLQQATPEEVQELERLEDEATG